MTDTDWAAVAEVIVGWSCTNEECDHHECKFLRAAAVGLRRLAQLDTAIGDPDELRWHRWHCEETGQGDDLRELLVRIADAADAADVAVAEGAEDRGQSDG